MGSREVWGLIGPLASYATGRLSWKLGLLVSCLVLAMMLLFTALDYQWHLGALWRDMDDHIAEEAWSVAAMLEQSRDTDWQRFVRSLGDALDRGERLGRHHEVLIIDSQGMVRASTVQELAGRAMISPEISKVLRGETQFSSGTMEHTDHLSFFGVVPLRSPEGPGIWAVHVAEPLTPIEESLRQFLAQRVLFMAVMAATVILAINLLVQRAVVRRLELLARGVEQVKTGNLRVQLPEQGNDEMAQIGAAFNRMIEALRVSQDALEAEHRRLALLYEVSRRLTGSFEWSDLVDRILAIIMDLAGAKGCCLFLVDRESGTLRLEGAMGIASELARPLSRVMARLDEAIRCVNCLSLRASLGDRCPMLSDLPDDVGIAGIACLRLALGDRTLGFINLFFDNMATATQRLEDLQLVATEIAAVVAAVQSQFRETAQAEELRRALHSYPSLEETLATALDQAAAAFQLRAAALFLADENGRGTELAYCHGVDPGGANLWLPAAQRAIDLRTTLTLVQEGEQISVVPLSVKGESLGALVCSMPQGTATREALGHLATFAGLLGMLIRSTQASAQAEAAAILRERNRLARELHDGLIQHLGYLKLTLSRMTGWAQQGHHARIAKELDNLRSSVEEAYSDARDAFIGLRVGLSPKDTLESVLSNYVEAFSARYQLPVHFQVQGQAPTNPMKPSALLHILRIVQEALTNVRRHSHADEASVELSYENDYLSVTVRDNGRGIDNLAEVSSHRGLRFMRERAKELSADLLILQRRPSGTEVRLKVPLENVAEGRHPWR